MKRRGFTLTELLVAIAIIGVLATLLLGALSAGLASARTAACLANASQTGKAWLQCVNSTASGTVGLSGPTLHQVQDSSGGNWTDKIAASAGGEHGIFKCPLQANSAKDAYGFGMNPTVGAEWGYLYGFFFGGYTLMPTDTRPRPLTLVKHPDRTLIVCESGTITAATRDLASSRWREDGAADWKPYVAFNLYDKTSAEAAAAAAITHGYNWGNTVPDHLTGGAICGSMGWDQSVRAVARHSGKCTTVFVDAHVEALEIGKLTDPAWNSDDCLFDNQK